MKRTILISGASRGIGKAIAIKALQDGHKISIGIREPETIRGTLLDPKISGESRVLVNRYDINDKDSLEKWIRNTCRSFGTFDSIINSSGIFLPTGFIYKDDEEQSINELIKINLLGPWQLLREGWNELEKKSQARIIVIVSMSGKRSKGNLAGYTASKFALMGLCQTIRNEGWEKGIRITAICPSWVNTDMAKNIQTIPKEDMTQPEDIASITTNILNLPNSCVPFEVCMNCMLEN